MEIGRLTGKKPFASTKSGRAIVPKISEFEIQSFFNCLRTKTLSRNYFSILENRKSPKFLH
jgi:hypothetical protein